MGIAGVAAFAALTIAVAAALSARRRSLIRAVTDSSARLGLPLTKPHGGGWIAADGAIGQLRVTLDAGRFPARIHPPQVVCRVTLTPTPSYRFRIARRGAFAGRARVGDDDFDALAAIETDDIGQLTRLLHEDLRAAIRKALQSTRVVTAIDELAVERRILYASDVYDATVEAIRIASMLCGAPPLPHFEGFDVERCRGERHDLQVDEQLDAHWASLLRCSWCGRWFVVVAHMKYDWPPVEITAAAAKVLREGDDVLLRAAFDRLNATGHGELDVKSFEEVLLRP